MKRHLYEVITSQLRQDIMQGKYAIDDMIPSENELAASFGTSRVTVRKSLQILEEEGLIRPHHGKGYFVLRPEQTRFTMYFADKISGTQVSYQKITVETVCNEIADELDIERGRMVVIVRKTILKDGKPIAYDEKFIPYERGVPVIEMEINYAEFPELFADKYVPASIWTDMDIAMRVVPNYAAKELGLEEGSYVMTATRYIRTKQGICIGCGKRYITADYGSIKARSGYYGDDLPPEN